MMIWKDSLICLERIKEETIVQTQSSQLFSKLGLGSVDLGVLIILIFILLIVCIVLLSINIRKVNQMKLRLDRFVAGKSGRSLEKDIKEMFEQNKMISTAAEKNKREIANIQKQLGSSYQKLGLVKYDAFNQMGGNLSFCLVLLNERNNGFIMNSVHSSDGCYSYTKEVKNGKCEIELGEEEKVALEMALDGDFDKNLE